tara:strand:+ start:3978 stop:5276 length:1299 start_codon:yes stop_codon:yes gene_type:complete
MGKGGGGRAARDSAAIQAGAARDVAEIQAQAQLDASELSSAAALEAANISASGSYAIAGSAAEAAQLNAGATSEAARLNAEATRYASDLQAESAARALAEQARQYNAAVTRFEPYVDLGTSSIQDYQGASTIEGYDQRLGGILSSDNFGELRADRQRVSDDYMARSGMTRSGAAIERAADVSTGLAQQIENQLYGRLGNNVNTGQTAAAQTSNIGSNYANQLTGIESDYARNLGNLATQGASTQSNLLTQGAATQGNFLMQGAQAGADAQNTMAQGILNSGNATAQGLLGSQQSYAQGVQGAADARAQGIITGAQADAASRNQFLNTALSAGMIAATAGAFTPVAASHGTVQSAGVFFSDERLKKNMEPIGKIKELTLYEWDWKDEYKDKVGMEMSIGFKAQEVEQYYPECVFNVNDVLAINYQNLHERLSA